MYYVVKFFSCVKPLIVESFDELQDAVAYAEILSRAGKGDYGVLTEIK